MDRRAWGTFEAGILINLPPSHFTTYREREGKPFGESLPENEYLTRKMLKLLWEIVFPFLCLRSGFTRV